MYIELNSSFSSMPLWPINSRLTFDSKRVNPIKYVHLEKKKSFPLGSDNTFSFSFSFSCPPPPFQLFIQIEMVIPQPIQHTEHFLLEDRKPISHLLTLFNNFSLYTYWLIFKIFHRMLVYLYHPFTLSYSWNISSISFQSKESSLWLKFTPKDKSHEKMSLV